MARAGHSRGTTSRRRTATRARREGAATEEREAYYRQRGLHTDERIGWVLTRAVDRWPNREALIFEGRRLTYRDLWRWVTAVAHDLVANGVRPGDAILWQLPNSLEGVVLHMAGWRIGAVCVPVVPLYREHEMAYIIGQVHPRVVAFSARLGDRRPAEEMQALMTGVGVAPALRLAVGGELDGWRGVRAFPEPDVEVTDIGLPDPAPADAHCLTLYTSGTTSNPKGAMHASQSLIAEAATWRDAYGFSGRDVFLMGAPITHIAGLLVAMILPPFVGARSALLPAWDPDKAVALAERERATFCAGATVFLQGFIERYEQGAAPTHRLSVFMCGGAAVPPSVIERADAVGIKAFRCWGMTEAPTTTLGRPDDPLELRANRDGKASEGTEIQTVDDDRKPQPPGTLGELRVRSPEQMLGYSDREVHAAQVDDEGWFYTGDVGVVDEGGWVVMTGRIKDIINRGGEKFSAQDIEYAIANHPAVEAVAVTGVPDERLGERVAAFVTLREGASWPGRQSLLGHLEAQRFAKQKFPVEWRVVGELPRTMSGKLQKNKLLEMWEAGLAEGPDPG